MNMIAILQKQLRFSYTRDVTILLTTVVEHSPTASDPLVGIQALCNVFRDNAHVEEYIQAFRAVQAIWYGRL